MENIVLLIVTCMAIYYVYKKIFTGCNCSNSNKCCKKKK